MAITVSEVQVTWAAANSVSIAAGGNDTSDAFVVDETCFQGTIQLKADNDGEPAAGDIVTFNLLATLGDPDGAGANEYGTTLQDTQLAALDTLRDDPAICTVQIPLPLVGGKIYAANGSAGRAITVSACLLEQRG